MDLMIYQDGDLLEKARRAPGKMRLETLLKATNTVDFISKRIKLYLEFQTLEEIDQGCKNAHEIFCVTKGKVLCHLPDEDLYEELEEGDAILIPPPGPHALINVRSNTVWSFGVKPNFRKVEAND